MKMQTGRMAQPGEPGTQPKERKDKSKAWTARKIQNPNGERNSAGRAGKAKKNTGTKTKSKPKERNSTRRA